MSGPLASMRVLDLTAFLAGPLAAQMLGDFGADVIKIETPPHGDTMRSLGPGRHAGMASQFLAYNRNKRSIALDLKHPQDYQALLKLVERADVLLHNMRPPAAVRLKIDYPRIAPVNPRIVYASAPGFRQDGPYRDRPAFDDLIQGMSGVAGMHLRRDGQPAYAPFNLADKLSAYCLVSAISLALLHRERSGEGQEVQVPMLETMLEFNTLDQIYGGVFEPPMAPGIGHPRSLSPHRRPFATQDGFICLQATTDHQFRNLFAALECPELIEDPRFCSVQARGRNLDTMLPLVAERLATRSTAEWQARLDAVDIPNAPMLQLDELLTDPYLAETGFFKTYTHPTEGTLRTTSTAMQFSKSPAAFQSGPPCLGEHTKEVLEEAGISRSEIESITARNSTKA